MHARDEEVKDILYEEVEPTTGFDFEGVAENPEPVSTVLEDSHFVAETVAAQPVSETADGTEVNDARADGSSEAKAVEAIERGESDSGGDACTDTGRVRTHSNEPRAKGNAKSTPLFELVSQRYISIEVLKEFNESKMYWRYKDSGGGTPLHRLCANTGCTSKHIEACSDVLAELRVAEVPDDMGRLPLHWVAMNPSATPELVTAIAALWLPAASSLAASSDYPRDTPLHAACRCINAPPSVLSTLSRLDVDVCLYEDHVGDVPLAILCSPDSRSPGDTDAAYYGNRGTSKEAQFLEQLVAVGDAAPNAARKRNAEGKMALHILCDTTSSASAIEYVGRLNPDAAIASDSVRRRNDMFNDKDMHDWTNSTHFTKDISQHSTLDEKAESGDSSKAMGKLRDSSSRRRRSLFAATKKMTKLFGNMSNFMGGSPTAKNNVEEEAGIPLHLLCRRSLRITPELIEAVVKLNPEAATTSTAIKGATPLHNLCMNEQNSTFANIKTLVELSPAAVDIRDTKERTPLDCMPNWLVDQLSPQLMELFPKMALVRFKGCSYCLLHYACTKEHDVVEAVVANMYAHMEKNPPLAIYLQLPEISRERLATTRVIVNQVDRIFTAPSVVAYLIVEFTTGLLMVIMFFDVCLMLKRGNQRRHPETRFIVNTIMALVHIVLIVLMKASQARALYRHNRFRQLFSIWNCADFSTVICFFATLFAGLFDRNGSFRVIASMSQLIVPFRILRIVKGLNKRIGAFVLCLTNIIVAIVPFLFVFAIVIISFSQSLHFLLSGNEARETAEIQIDGSIEPENPFESIALSIYEVMLIALVGDFERDLFQTDLSIILICLMLVVVVVILLNVLISVVSDSYERTLTNAESIYLRSRLETAAEMQQVFPRFFFNRGEGRIIGIIGLFFLPITLLWLTALYFFRLVRGPRVAEELMPRRIFAYAKPPGQEEEEEGNSATSQTDVLQKNLLNYFKKFQDDLNSRINSLEEEVKLTVEHELKVVLERLDQEFRSLKDNQDTEFKAIKSIQDGEFKSLKASQDGEFKSLKASQDIEFKSLKASQDYKDILTKQNAVLDNIINSLSTPIANLPADVRSRVDRERGIARANEDEDDALFPSCVADLERARASLFRDLERTRSKFNF